MSPKASGPLLLALLLLAHVGQSGLHASGLGEVVTGGAASGFDPSHASSVFAHQDMAPSISLVPTCKLQGTVDDCCESRHPSLLSCCTEYGTLKHTIARACIERCLTCPCA